MLSEGVNLQQAHNIINYDLPWNPMRLVQRHGRVDRIGSKHSYVYLWCFFPDVGMDRLLNLERILHRKLMKAAKSIGTGQVLPGMAASDDVVFNARRDQIQSLAEGDNALFLGTSGGLIFGEEFRAMLRKAIENESLARKLEAMPWASARDSLRPTGRPATCSAPASSTGLTNQPSAMSPSRRRSSHGPGKQMQQRSRTSERSGLWTASPSTSPTGPTSAVIQSTS